MQCCNVGVVAILPPWAFLRIHSTEMKKHQETSRNIKKRAETRLPADRVFRRRPRRHRFPTSRVLSLLPRLPGMLRMTWRRWRRGSPRRMQQQGVGSLL